MNLSRRSLLGLAVAGSAGAAAHAVFAAFSAVLKSRIMGVHNGRRLVTIGMKPKGVLPTPINSEASVLTNYDLSTGAIAATPLPGKEIHSLVSIGQGYALISNHSKIFFSDSSFAIRGELAAEPGFEFGGHAVYLPNVHSLVVGVRPGPDNEAPGQLLVIDMNTLKPTRKMPSGGLDPHHIEHLSDDCFGVCHYGDRFRVDLMKYESLTPNICLYSSTTLKLLSTISFPKIGAVSHIAPGIGTDFAAISANLYPFTAESLGTVSGLIGKSSLGISAVEEIEGKIGGPSHLLFLNRNATTMRSSLEDPVNQRRAQSIFFHAPTESYFVTYPFSNTVARIAQSGETTFISGFAMGLEAPRGVTGFSGEDSIYISGQYHGIVEISASTLEVKNRIDIQNHCAIHIFCA